MKASRRSIGNRIGPRETVEVIRAKHSSAQAKEGGRSLVGAMTSVGI
jgi:hypothetical protein